MQPVAQFAALVRRPGTAVPLDEGALLIAQCAHPTLDLPAQMARLDALAADAGEATAAGVVDVLFARHGFTGNRVDYYDPRNSFLDDVLDRRLGIPISLAVVLIEVGRRVGVPLLGVGMPGHFLVRDAADPELFVDAFAGGRVLDRRGCRQLYRGMHGAGAPFREQFLEPVGAAQILQRMVANLRNVFVQRNDTRSLAWALELHTAFPDVGPDAHRELGAVHRANGAFVLAAESYERAAVRAELLGADPAPDVAAALALPRPLQLTHATIEHHPHHRKGHGRP